MRKNSDLYTKIDKQRKEAKQGDFFFANYLVDGQIRKAPAFVAGNDGDDEDVIICKCTAQPPKTEYDKKVQLKKETYVRTNKIYTIQRNQLLFKIPQQPTNEEFKEIMDSIKYVFNL